MSRLQCCNVLQQYLTSDMKTLMMSSKKACHNRVWLAPLSSSRCCEWRIIPAPKKFRMELEHTPVPVSFVVNVASIMPH